MARQEGYEALPRCAYEVLGIWSTPPGHRNPAVEIEDCYGTRWTIPFDHIAERCDPPGAAAELTPDRPALIERAAPPAECPSGLAQGQPAEPAAAPAPSPERPDERIGLHLSPDGNHCNDCAKPWPCPSRVNIERALTAAASPDPERPNAASEIDRLAAFIMNEVPGEPSASGSAVDTAIRLIRNGFGLRSAAGAPSPDRPWATMRNATPLEAKAVEYAEAWIAWDRSNKIGGGPGNDYAAAVQDRDFAHEALIAAAARAPSPDPQPADCVWGGETSDQRAKRWKARRRFRLM